MLQPNECIDFQMNIHIDILYDIRSIIVVTQHIHVFTTYDAMHLAVSLYYILCTEKSELDREINS